MNTIPLTSLVTHRQELRHHADALRHAWDALPDSTQVLRYEQALTGEICTRMIDRLRDLQAVAESVAAYVEPRPLLVSVQSRLGPMHLSDKVDMIILQLVLLRDICREVSLASLRERQQTNQHFRDLQTTFQQTVAALDTDAHMLTASTACWEPATFPSSESERRDP